ncbi:MAG: endonuclease III [Prevotella sp.]
MKREERYEKILGHFRKEMPYVTTELNFGSEFQLLVAVMLSAQCTDKRVNMVTPELFRLYPNAETMAKAEVDDIFELIKSVSYPNSKASHLAAMARQLMSQFNGEVPRTLDELISLPGVGRKTANVMLSVAFGQGAMPVDTHVFRVSRRIGLVNESDNTPLKVEQRLSKYIAHEELGLAHHWILLHGRYVCTARKPHCEQCPISEACKSFMELRS